MYSNDLSYQKILFNKQIQDVNQSVFTVLNFCSKDSQELLATEMGNSGNKRCGILSGILGSMVTLGIGIVIGLYAIGSLILRVKNSNFLR